LIQINAIGVKKTQLFPTWIKFQMGGQMSADTAVNPSFSVHEGPLVIDGTYSDTNGHLAITITEVDLCGFHLHEHVTLTGMAATEFNDIFHILR
jgi:hypothetical protein